MNTSRAYRKAVWCATDFSVQEPLSFQFSVHSNEIYTQDGGVVMGVFVRARKPKPSERT